MTELRDLLDKWKEKTEPTNARNELIPEWAIDELESMIREWIQNVNHSTTVGKYIILPKEKIMEK